MSAIITFTTDLGLSDAYVAAMKGAILGINPEAKLIDISHSIHPQNTLQAAFVLNTAYPFFPKRTIHLIVVDPGVGTRRRAVILRTPSADFVAPDNGVLSYVVPQSPVKTNKAKASLRQVELPTEMKAVSITNSRLWRSPVSSTFHGRDIFAPVAANLSLSLPLTDFGKTITSLNLFPVSRPYQAADGSLIGRIIHIDSFGNLITNIKSLDLPRRNKVIIRFGNQSIFRLSRTYAEGKELLALIGSSNYLEIALKGSNAQTFLKAEIGDKVKLRLVGKE
jgi:S-adenosylmethionine hydrolase